VKFLNRGLSIAASAVALTVGLAACGGDSGEPAADDTQPVAQVSSLSGEQTQVTLDPGFVEALTSLKVTPAPVGDATIESGVASFPITGGNVKYFKPGTVSPYVQGELMHDGSGLSLTAGDTTVELTDFVVDPAKSKLFGDVSVNGKMAAEDAYLFFLNGKTLEPLQVNESEGTAVLEGTKVLLSADAAKLLNDTFKIDALKQNLPIGVAEITIETS